MTSRVGTKDRIQEGRKWAKDKLAQGWHYTPDGLLPPEEIFLAGFVWDDTEEDIWDYETNQMVRKQRGYVSIPAQTYISDGSDGKKAGEKYVSASRDYLKWKEDYEYRRSHGKPITEQIKEQPKLANKVEADVTTEQYGVTDENGEIIIDRIPF